MLAQSSIASNLGEGGDRGRPVLEGLPHFVGELPGQETGGQTAKKIPRLSYSNIFAAGTISTSSGRKPRSQAPTILSSARILAGLAELY